MSNNSKDSKNSNISYLQVIPSDLNFMVFSNLTVPSLFSLCQNLYFNSLICSKTSFWTRYYFFRFNKHFQPTKEFSTPKDFFIKANNDYQSHMNDKRYNEGLELMAKYGLKKNQFMFGS